MKILVSAYACDPYRGSEPGVGWTAVTRIARDHEVFVMAGIHNKEGWERGAKEGIIPENVHIRFIGKRDFCSQNRLIAHCQSWLKYALFSRRVLRFARLWHDEEVFDLCHQVTIAGWRMPSPLWQLPIPFVWGPIGGAGHIPGEFRSMLSPASRIFEWVRDLNTAVAVRSRAFKDCLRESAVIFAANEETELFLKPHRGSQPLVRLPIASIPTEKALRFKRPDGPSPSGPLRLFAGGNMEGRKGVSLALKALAKVAKAGIDFRYTVAGGGPEIASLKVLAAELGISDRVDFHQGFSGEAYIQALHETDVYFLPSFRESTPVTLLEAYLAGCYPVVADTSAQGEIVRLAGGIAVPVTDMESLISGLADAVIRCHEERAELSARNQESLGRLMTYFDSKRYDESISHAYEKAMA